MPEPFEIDKEYAECVKAWGPSALPPLEQIRVTLEDQMTRTMGRAMPKHFHRPNGQVVKRDYYAITLSAPLIQALIDNAGLAVAKAQLRETIIHELAHIATYHMWPELNVVHGNRWRRLMVLAGLSPDRCYDTDPDDGINWRAVKAQARR